MTTGTQRVVPTMDDFRDGGTEGEVFPPTYMREGDTIIGSGADDPSGMTISALRFKGYVKVWDTQTGIMSLQPWWLLWQTMRKKHEDGTLAFTRTDPHITPNYGLDLLCPLNPASPEYEAMKSMGFKPCRKHGIPHKDALMRHIRKSHGRAAVAIETATAERIRQEDRSLQVEAIKTNQKLLETLVRNATPTEMLNAYVDPKVSNEAVIALSKTAARMRAEQFTVSCPRCNKEFRGDTEDNAAFRVNSHKRFCKA